MKTIKRGMRGPDVTALQQSLNAVGASIDVDGIFGAQTEAAVRAFQRAHKLTADGVAGPATQIALTEEGHPVKSPSTVGPDAANGSATGGKKLVAGLALAAAAVWAIWG